MPTQTIFVRRTNRHLSLGHHKGILKTQMTNKKSDRIFYRFFTGPLSRAGNNSKFFIWSRIVDELNKKQLYIILKFARPTYVRDIYNGLQLMRVYRAVRESSGRLCCSFYHYVGINEMIYTISLASTIWFGIFVI